MASPFPFGIRITYEIVISGQSGEKFIPGRHLLSETEEEHEVWKVIRATPPLKKIASAALLKILLPILTLAETQTEGTQDLRKEWGEAYGWLPEKEREGLLNLAHHLMDLEGRTLQERLERATFLIIDADL